MKKQVLLLVITAMIAFLARPYTVPMFNKLLSVTESQVSAQEQPNRLQLHAQAIPHVGELLEGWCDTGNAAMVYIVRFNDGHGGQASVAVVPNGCKVTSK